MRELWVLLHLLFLMASATFQNCAMLLSPREVSEICTVSLLHPSAHTCCLSVHPSLPEHFLMTALRWNRGAETHPCLRGFEGWPR